jgi:hypothetical protein
MENEDINSSPTKKKKNSKATRNIEEEEREA